MAEFWEESFIEKQTMWGFEPSESAIVANELFKEKQLKNILVPGFGYGRNAQLFRESGMVVTGIEISQTAIDLARQHYGADLKVYHGSVTDMPFDDVLYDGIFCYALIHLLNQDERRKLVSDCYSQLSPGGYMVFVAVSTKSPNYGTGRQLSRNRFEIFEGVQMYFYDEAVVKQEFGNYTLVDFKEIEEPTKHMPGKPPLRFYMVTCRKEG
ncbi:class I SAM-dependent methyltransferase [Pontibacter burrus]|uniref:Class I SAM-dependent methyltransferase n=1 Tax=Pontibacter burrus TaxID=2704466 RepID=A0A6B3LUR5_9BACT|nr:class I SAM-dependent methyltransferase [Pontibacter burrus]NEM98006.1 class I SAM-dependent methyltransferase [Pontibacter burrus]